MIIEKVDVSSDNLINDNNAKIMEMEEILKEMKKKLDKVTESVEN